MYTSVIYFLSRRLIPVPFLISVHSVHFTSSSALHQSGKQQHTISRLCPKFVSHYSQQPSCNRGSFSSSKYKLIISKYILTFPFNPPSKYPLSSICCTCQRVDCAIFAAFASFRLLFSRNRCKFIEILGPVSRFVLFLVISATRLRPHTLQWGVLQRTVL